MNVYSSVPYFSRSKRRGLSPECDQAQDLVQAVKDGDRKAIKEGIGILATHPKLRGFKGIVTAAPRSKAGRPSGMVLARELVKAGVGKKAVEMVVRKSAVPSSRMRRRKGLAGIGKEKHVESMAFAGRASDEPVLIVDDVVTTGATLDAVAHHIRAAAHTGPVMAATVGYFTENVRQAAACPVKHVSRKTGGTEPSWVKRKATSFSEQLVAALRS